MRPAKIAKLRDSTTEDRETGAVRSVQTADLSLPESALQALWSPSNLERLGRTYWRFLARVTLGLVRVRYTESERFVILIASPLKLIAFKAPEYEMDAAHGLVRWRIERGLLVAKQGRGGHGHLQIQVRPKEPPQQEPPQGPTPQEPPQWPTPPELTPQQEPPQHAQDPGHVCLHIEIEVANFHPAIASGLGRWIYRVTQSKIHVFVTNRFLRSLARLDLAESKVGRLAQR